MSEHGKKSKTMWNINQKIQHQSYSNRANQMSDLIKKPKKSNQVNLPIAFHMWHPGVYKHTFSKARPHSASLWIDISLKCCSLWNWRLLTQLRLTRMLDAKSASSETRLQWSRCWCRIPWEDRDGIGCAGVWRGRLREGWYDNLSHRCWNRGDTGRVIERTCCKDLGWAMVKKPP